MKPLRLLDLFSGIGGFSLGLERTGGFETVAFCEIEPYARAVLAAHWPGVPCYDDVTTLTSERLAADGVERVDAISGGFPCQDVSFQGKGAGLEGARSGLWSEIKRLTRELQPRFVFVENVSALLDRGMGRVLGDLAEIGYDAEWHCIPASYVGASHERDRVWIIAYPSQINDRSACPQGSASLAERIISASRAPGSNSLCKHEGRATITLGGEPAICELDDGLSYSLVQAQLARLGNTVVPQIPELIGRAIIRELDAPRAPKGGA